MNTDSHTLQEVRSAVLNETISFLIGCKSGASPERLAAIVDNIKAKEVELFKATGSRLSPEIWQFLQKRLDRSNSNSPDLPLEL